ncbi:MAG: glycosyltransferase family 4 protein [Alphaproteobacteria bacterium]|nr:glycosyltransferase family 4 protein [Alphaproteobacteria bacterium]
MEIGGSHLVWILAVFLASAATVRLLLVWLQKRAILDRPNERSSHSVPTPRGGGLAVMAVVLGGWAFLALREGAPARLGVLILASLVLIGVSWLDDRRPGGMSPLWRLIVQIGAVLLGLAALPPGPVFQGLLPGWLDVVATAFLWLWFLNLFNFMDGIDGITGVETIAIASGMALMVNLAALHPDLAALSLVLAASALGFLVWNWHPARIFLGDVGSVPLGFLLGWLLLTLASLGQWAAALILPAFYLADATITLFRRALKREKIWQAHRSHFYQRAVQQGWSHAQVSARIGFTNAALIAMAATSLERPLAALLAAAALIVGLLFLLSQPRHPS